MKLFKDKYRILEEDNMFYPQIREFFVWCKMYNFSDSDSIFWGVGVIYFNKLEDAINFIDSEISETNSLKSKKIIHKYKN